MYSGRQEPFLNRRRDPALEEDRACASGQLAQQRVVLHVARANLVDVGVAANQLDLADSITSDTSFMLC
jgi:hypothetical protein